MKNGSKAGIREVFSLMEDLRKDFNNRMDNLENNHIQHLSERITSLEQKVWMAIGAITAITLLLKLIK